MTVSTRSRTIAMALAFVAMTGVVALRTARNLNVAGQPNLPGGDGLHDFRDVLYYPVVAVLDGRNPYDAVTFMGNYPVARPLAPYAPTTLLLHLPFGVLPYAVAEWTHFALNAALMLALAWLCLRACGLAPTAARVFGLGTLILLSRPAHMTLYIGQCSAYIVLATYVALVYARSRPALAGLALAVTCVKPTFGVPLGILLLVRRDLRPIAWGAGISVAALGVIGTVLARAAGGVLPLVATFRESYARLMQDPSANPASSIIRIDGVAFLGRLAGHTADPRVETLVTFALLAVGAAAVWRVERTRDDRLWSTCVAGLTVLVCMYHQAYDGLLLALPLTALMTGRLGTGGSRAEAAARALAIAAMLVPVTNYVATDTFVDALGFTGAARTAIASVNGAAVVVAFAVVVALALRAPERAGRSVAAGRAVRVEAAPS